MIIENSRRTEQAVILSTVHSSKGQEYDTVYIMDAFNGYMPRIVLSDPEKKSKKAEEYQEERRLFYVAMTRAKNHLYIFGISSCNSSFLKELFPGNYQTKGQKASVVVIHDELTSHTKMTPRLKKSQYLDIIRSQQSMKSTYKISSDDLSKYAVGAKVHHLTFGDGTIMKINTINGTAHHIEVDFVKGGVRKLHLEMILKSKIIRIVSDSVFN